MVEQRDKIGLKEKETDLRANVRVLWQDPLRLLPNVQIGIGQLKMYCFIDINFYQLPVWVKGYDMQVYEMLF